MSAPGSSAPLRLGTRRSPLALHQAGLVRDAVRRVEPGVDVELVEMTSEGDRDPRELRVIGDRGIFARTLERALEAGEVDAAVHSSKDLALEPTAGLVLAAWLEREDPRDALVGCEGGIDELPEGAHVATGSARRMAALRTLRSDLVPMPVRGNVRTRIDRVLARGDAALVLAMAGLVRLGIHAERDDVVPLTVEQMVPEAGQGAVVVQARAHVCDSTGFDWSRIDHRDTRRTVDLERELARLLGGGCEHPVGVHVELEAGRIHAFSAPSPDQSGRTVLLELVGLELATLVGVADAADVLDAAHSAAARIAPQLAELLGVEVTA